ncbi:MAG: hypothetical protein JWO38_5432 [Gemmataceae bacterium]|nr:hypothetical protein [Gemmataceae bacterium]
MSRIAGMLVAFLCFVQTAGAMMAERRATVPRPDVESIRPTPPAPAPATTVPDGQFKLTADSEVLLNGRACEYKDVPKEATVVRIELSADRKTILKIEFRTKK